MENQPNGHFCGPSKLTPNWLKKILSPEVLNFACYNHDCRYAEKNSIKRALFVNKNFYRQMKESIKIYDCSKKKRVKYYIQAFIYYILVNLCIPFYWLFSWVWMKPKHGGLVKDKKIEKLIDKLNKKWAKEYEKNGRN